MLAVRLRTIIAVCLVWAAWATPVLAAPALDAGQQLSGTLPAEEARQRASGGRGPQRPPSSGHRARPTSGQQVSRVAVGARPSVAALATEAEIELDGVLNEAVWQQAERGTAFTQREPFQGEPATEQTFVQVVYTDDTLYIGIRALDSDPGSIIAKDMQRDGGGGGFRGARLESDDSIVVLLDTFHDQRNAFYFETNPLAARVDAMITDEGRDRNFDWDGVWNVAAQRTEEGWSAEFAIPFNTLRFNPANDTWGLNVRRMIRRKSEEVNWAPIMRDADMFRVSQFGQLNNMAAGNPSRNLRFKPFIVAQGDEGVSTEVGDMAGDTQVGLDVRWGVTDSMTLDVTINTDFAQVEADEQRINLTRFSLFFPEKREFFLESAGIFQFASGGGGGGGFRGPLMRVYHSRQIGIAGGEEIPIIAGGKLTGRAGDWNVGLLNVQTAEHVFPLDEDEEPGEEEIEPSTNWSVARVTRNIGERSNVGVIFTNRQSSGFDYNRVVGVDTTLNPNQNMAINGYFAASDNPGDDGQNWAGGGGFNWRGPIWRFSANFDDIREDFDPQVGFLTRRGVRHFNPQITFEPRPGRVSWIRNLTFEARNTVFSLTDGTLETWDGSYRFFGFRTMSEDWFSFSFNPSYERLFEPFEIRDGIVIPVGEYTFHDWSIFMNTSDGRPVNVSWRFSNGGFYDGDRLNSNITVNWRPSPYIRSETEWGYNNVDLPQGAFTTHVVRQRINLSFSPDLSLNSFIQYLDTDDLLSMNTRFRWIYRPGADLFVVYNHNWTSGATENRALIFKFTYLWAL